MRAGTRPLTPPQSDSCATTRKQAIDQSSKPDCLSLISGATLGGTALSPRSMCWQAGHLMIRLKECICARQGRT